MILSCLINETSGKILLCGTKKYLFPLKYQTLDGKVGFSKKSSVFKADFEVFNTIRKNCNIVFPTMPSPSTQRLYLPSY